VYGCAFGNLPADFDGMTDPVGVDGNVSVDPLFLDVSAADPLTWDLHQDVTSTLVDGGDPADLDPDGSQADIGPYGGPTAASWDLDGDGYPEWWLPGAYDPATSPSMDCEDQDSGVGPGTGC